MKLMVVPPSVKKNEIAGLAKKHRNIIYAEDIVNADPLSDFYPQFKYFSRNWFRAEGVKDALEFKGINIGAYFFMPFALCLPRILRAADLSIALLEKYGKHDLVLADDEQIWARTFKCVAKFYNKEIVTFVLPRHGKTRRDFRVQLKEAVKEKAATVYKILTRRFTADGTIFSCAGRFAEQLWDVLGKDAAGYFLRPAFSLKEQLKLSRHVNKMQITDRFFSSAGDRKEVARWLRENDIKAKIDGYFSISHFFRYRGIDIWDIAKDDIFRLFDEHLEESMLLICRFNTMFSILAPRRIIVEEDLCSFNKILLECALKAGIPVFHIMHGLLTFDIFAGEMMSDIHIVQGEYARDFLVEAGIRKEKIFAIGAPHYAKKMLSYNKDNTKIEFLRRFNLPEKSKIITLITQPRYTEEDPYWNADHPLTHDNFEIMLDVSIEAMRNTEGAVLVVKAHHIDHDVAGLRQSIKNKNLTNKVLLLTEYDSVDLVAVSSVVLCGPSTVYLEALLMRTPVFMFDSLSKKYWGKIKSDCLYLEEKASCIERVRGVLNDPQMKGSRLEKQEEELSWHFKDKNVNSVKDFQELIGVTGAEEKADNKRRL